MYKRLTLALSFLMLVTVLIVGCGNSNTPSQPTTDKISYEIIKIPSADFNTINKGDFATWYTNNYKNNGLYSYSLNEEKYFLLGVGEKPTGGYYIEELSVIDKINEIEVTANLHSPTENEDVSDAITYPHLLFKIKHDIRPIAFNGVTGNTFSSEIETDSGEFLGQIDNNSIEIKISGGSEEIPPKAFQLSEELKENIMEYDLDIGDEIT
ncbi:MAG: protease complex subunit PrcB family protein [Clostridia bacterium]|nr:protease complex subunit PrcB family protein [Clostridia bacterium]